MNRLLVNGSPRGVKSNSRLLLSWVAAGMETAGAENPPVIDLAETNKLANQIEAFLSADEIVFVMPLYTDSAPGIVVNFLNALAGAGQKRLAGKRIAFMVQSGFPESIHSEALADWLARLCVRLGLVNCGIAIKGGVEGIREMPPAMSRKLQVQCNALGQSLVDYGFFDQEIVRTMAKPRLLGWGTRLAFALAKPFGLLNFYWNMKLKQHNAWKRRFDQPFA